MRVSPRRCAIVLPCVPGHGLDTLHPLVTLAVVSYTTKMGFSVLTFGYLWNFEKHACSKTILRCILPSKVARLSRYRVVGTKLDADSYRFSVGSRLLISIEALENFRFGQDPLPVIDKLGLNVEDAMHEILCTHQ